MTNKTTEFFVIVDCSGEYNPRDDELFDSFEEARKHIGDTDENGRYKYHGWWTDSQECNIKRYFAAPGFMYLIVTDEWKFRNEKLIENMDKHPYYSYKGEVW